MILLFTAFSSALFAQKYMDDIAKKSCECVGKLDKNISEEDVDLQFGFCLIEASIPYKKQLLKDHKIDMDQLDTYGSKLGEIVGLKMAATCPSVFRDNSSISSELETSGEVVKIEDDLFVNFSIKNSSNKIEKFYWLTGVELDPNLQNNYNQLLGKTVSITYENLELFDPKIKEYREFSIMNSLNIQ